MILILDEPTNYLDEEHIRWLTNYLQNYENAFILVSHDVPFLNDVVNIIYHVENCTLTRYVGDYQKFEEGLAMKRRQMEAAYNRQQKEIDELQDFIQRNKARVATRNMAASRQKKLDKMDLLSKPKIKIKPEFTFLTARTPGKVLFKLNDLVIGYDEPLTRPINMEFERNRKIAIKGVNGLGKSTLLKTLTGLLQPYSGEVETDPYLEIGYFEQEAVNNTKTALQEIWDCFPGWTNNEVRSALAKCGLTTDHIETSMMVLSGGENAKVRLCRILNQETNVLVLDEPTNHLDVEAKDELKKAIREYRGSVILVSHDPEFYEDIVDEVLNVEDWTTKVL